MSVITLNDEEQSNDEVPCYICKDLVMLGDDYTCHLNYDHDIFEAETPKEEIAKDVIRKLPEVISNKYTPEYLDMMFTICDEAESDEDLEDDVELSEDDEEVVGDDEVVNTVDSRKRRKKFCYGPNS